jgi:transcriptional regulator of acetoin/glycerol metabolism
LYDGITLIMCGSSQGDVARSQRICFVCAGLPEEVERVLDGLAELRIEKAKNAVLDAPDDQPGPSAALLSSWRRSKAALGMPSNVRDVPHVAEELLDTQLLETFRAPMQRFAETLDGTGLGLLLADASGRILERWTSDHSSRQQLDRVGTFRGSVLSEEAVGTNGVGTALVTGQLVQVRGAEHFADFYSQAVCTGAPVLHPLSGKILGAVTLSCDITPRLEFLPPLLKTVVGQLQQHVLDIEQPASRRALEAFLHYANTRTDPVIALGPQGLVIQNASASRLSREQVEEIQRLCRDVGDTSRRIRSGELTLEITAVEKDNHVAVIVDEPRSAPARGVRDRAVPAALVGRAPEWLAALHEVARAREEAAPLVLAGEPGVGKSSVALGTPRRPGALPPGRVVVDAAGSHVLGARDWLQDVAERLRGGVPVCVRGAETLDPSTVAGLRSVLENADGATPVTVTVTAGAQADAEDLAVRLGGERVVWIPALRDRLADLPDLWTTFARSVAPESRLVLQPDALSVLRGHRWPGNLSELRRTVDTIARSGKTGPVAASDLPASMRSNGTGLTLIEQVEIRAIRQALEEAGGNRAKAAEILGLSRATVYRKMKSYRLTT